MFLGATADRCSVMRGCSSDPPRDPDASAGVVAMKLKPTPSAITDAVVMINRLITPSNLAFQSAAWSCSGAHVSERRVAKLIFKRHRPAGAALPVGRDAKLHVTAFGWARRVGLAANGAARDVTRDLLPSRHKQQKGEHQWYLSERPRRANFTTGLPNAPSVAAVR